MQKVKSIWNGKKSIKNGKKYARNIYKDANVYANVSNCMRNDFSRYTKCWYAKRHKAKRHQASLAQNIVFTLSSCHSMSFSLSLLTRDRLVNFKMYEKYLVRNKYLFKNLKCTSQISYVMNKKLLSSAKGQQTGNN